MSWVIYDFTCDECKKTEERMVSRADLDNQRCDICNSLLRKELCTPMFDQGEAYRACNYVALNKKEYERKMYFDLKKNS